MTKTTPFLILTAGKNSWKIQRYFSLRITLFSQLEEQAIQASQALDVRRNLEKDIFGTDDEEDEEVKLGKEVDMDMFDTDDEKELEAAAVEADEDKDLEDTLKLSESVTNRWFIFCKIILQE